MSSLRVVLVDDAPLIRQGIARLLADEGVEVVAQRPDATDILETVGATKPDVVILDVRMPPSHTTEGLEAALELKRLHPDLGVLALSQHVETRHAVDLLTGAHGGVGYLLKDRIAAPADLVSALTRIAAGETIVDPEVVRRVLETPRSEDPLQNLTGREREVLALVAEGHSNASIAGLLEATERTIESHTSRIFSKLELSATPTTHRRVLAVLAHLRASTT